MFNERERIVEAVLIVVRFFVEWGIDMMFYLRERVTGGQMLSSSEAMKYLGVSRSTLDRRREERMLTGYDQDGRWFYRKSDLEDYQRRFPQKE